MGLDVYVGTLTRYYGGDWSLITQQMGAAAGIETTVVRHDSASALAELEPATDAPQPGEPEPGSTSWLGRLGNVLGTLSVRLNSRPAARAAPPLARTLPPAEAVAAWRDRLNQKLARKLPAPLYWDESAAAPYFTDKPGWGGHSCLSLLAVHDELPELPRPKHATDNCAEDSAWLAASRDNFARSHYRHILEPMFWLPCEFDFVFPTDDTGGEAITVGYSIALLAQLRELNDRTFQGSPEDLAEWLRAGPEPGEAMNITASPEVIKRQLAEQSWEPAPFEYTARFGLALFLDLAEKAVTHRLPMRLDW